MLTAVLLNIGNILIPWFLAYIAIEFTIRPLESAKMRRSVRLIFVVAAVLQILISWKSTARAEKQSSELPERVAEYVRNTMPPVAVPVVRRPAPPTGLVGTVDGAWSSEATNMANQLLSFLYERGNAPVHKQGEADLDYIIRSNAWYSSVMDQYRRQLGEQVVTTARVLIEKGVLDAQVMNLAKDPQNPLGIRILASQLTESATKYRSKYELKQ